jgi:hypothetical protein
VQILLDNRVVLEEMTQQLLEREVLDGTMMQNFLARARSAESLEDRPITETEELTAIIGR